MTNQPETAWVEAAKNAADRTTARLGREMESIDLGLKIVGAADAAGTNSADSSFLDYLARGEHLNGGFLANAR